MEGVSDEQLAKIKESWDKYGDCRSCGWHSAFYEVHHHIFPDILDEKNHEKDGSFWIPCTNEEDSEEDTSSHRGCNLYDFKL